MSKTIRTKTSQVDFEEAFKSKYIERAYLIEDMRKALKVKKVKWSDLTKTNLTKVVDYLRTTHAPNSARTLVAVIKAFLNLYAEEVKIPCKTYARVLRVKRVPSQHVALTEAELRRFIAYKPRTKVEEEVQTLAIRSALCGARGCDVEKMSVSNIGEDDTISYVAKKTKRSATIPLHHLLREYLQRNVSKEYTRATKNRIVKTICRRIGMSEIITLFVNGKPTIGPKWQFVSFHSMRRTFATLLASKGVPVSVIQAWMTHSSPMMTSNYICTDIKQENQRYKELFL